MDNLDKLTANTKQKFAKLKLGGNAPSNSTGEGALKAKEVTTDHNGKVIKQTSLKLDRNLYDDVCALGFFRHQEFGEVFDEVMANYIAKPENQKILEEARALFEKKGKYKGGRPRTR